MGFFMGSLPLGSYVVKRLTGKDIGSFSAHNLGVENLFEMVGSGVALSSFFLDVLKAFLVVMAFPEQPWAALGVFLGHLYPWARLSKNELPRGRGNGVLLGILAGWSAMGVVWWAVSLPVLVYAVLLAVTRYVAASTLGALAFLFALSLLTSASTAFVVTIGAIFVLALWRHKASLARMMDKLEPKLGEPPAVFDVDPSTVPVAFMIHPMGVDDLWQAHSNKWLQTLFEAGLVPEKLLRWVLPHLRPQVHGVIEGIELKDGRKLRVLLIGGPMLPEQIRENPDMAVRMAIRGARLAQWQGAQVFGLGAFWSTVGHKGKDVQAAVPEIFVTNGGAYTAASIKDAVPGLLKSFAKEGGSLKRSCAAIVGANGVVAFGMARTIAPEIAELCLIGRDEERLERSAKSLRKKHPETIVTTSVDMASCDKADLIFTATSDPDPVLFAEHVKPGAWVFDLGRPSDVDESVRAVPGVHIIPGGVVRPPGELRSSLDIHFGNGLVPACLAESMVMAATKAYDRASLGDVTKSANITFYLEEAKNLGFEIVTRDERMTQDLEAV